MPFVSRRPVLVVSEEQRQNLTKLSRARNRPGHMVERAGILLAFADGQTVSAIARQFRTNRPKVERCINKALELGVQAALDDLPRSGKPASISSEARAWVVALACQKPKDLGYPHEMWTTTLLAEHVRVHAEAAGYPALRRLARGTVSKILTKSQVRPHKISYYLERRDPEFEAKMAQVLLVYRHVELLREAGAPPDEPLVAILSYDEKPGIQALGTTAPDRLPAPVSYPTLGRDHEYVRHGTVTLMAGIDLLTGKVHATVVQRHRSREFVAFLQTVDAAYPADTLIRVILDNHAAHISKETRAFLATKPSRFEFIFTPKHGSWLNIIESFFAKMAHTVLRGIRVGSLDELRSRIERWIEDINQAPVVFRWRYKLAELTIA
jgi:transposase